MGVAVEMSSGGEAAVDSVQAHLRWRVGLEEVETEGGSLRSNTMRTWVFGETIDWQIWVSIGDNVDKKIFVVPLTHTLKEDLDRELQCSVFFQSRYSEIFMKSFTKPLASWIGRGEGIAFSEKTLQNMTDSDNRLGIVVDLVIPAEVIASECESKRELLQDLSIFSRENAHSDLTIECKGERFSCHKALLAARSPVLSALLKSEMVEAATSTISIEDARPTSVRTLLDYLYTGQLPQSVDEEGELLHLAVKYHLPALTKHLEVDLARWQPSLPRLLHHLVLSFLYLPTSKTHDQVLKEAQKRPGLFEIEEWRKVELNYPKLASLVLD